MGFQANVEHFIAAILQLPNGLTKDPAMASKLSTIVLRIFLRQWWRCSRRRWRRFWRIVESHLVNLIRRWKKAGLFLAHHVKKARVRASDSRITGLVPRN